MTIDIREEKNRLNSRQKSDSEFAIDQLISLKLNKMLAVIPSIQPVTGGFSQKNSEFGESPINVRWIGYPGLEAIIMLESVEVKGDSKEKSRPPV